MSYQVPDQQISVAPPISTGVDTRALLAVLRSVGIEQGDAVFFHVGFEALGGPGFAVSGPADYPSLFECLQQAVGPTGSILLPAYTFSFCRQELFDVQDSPAQPGPWCPSTSFVDYVRHLPGVVRSRDPIHSVIGTGPGAEALLDEVSNSCFGPGSIHDRLLSAGAKISLLGPGFEEATFRHFIEERAGVPFRFKKLFTGRIRYANGDVRKTGWLYSVRPLIDSCYPNGRRIEAEARHTGLLRAAKFGNGEVLAISTTDYCDLLTECLKIDPWFTARGPAVDIESAELRRVNGPVYSADLPPAASAREIIEGLWHLPRHLVSDAYDAALDALSHQLPMHVHQYPSGTECWDWIIPERWTCHEAYLERIDGHRLFSVEDHALHVVSYSLPFAGVVTRQELLDHLHVHPYLEDAVPFIFKYYERDWGLCCSQSQRDTLTDSHYRVAIRSDFSYGTLKVGEVIAPGRSQSTIVLCAHLCHPAMVNDDISGVAVGMEVMRTLLARTDLRFTYRFLILPETIGSVAWISQNEHLIPELKGGIFLEMLGVRNPHALQLSFYGDTEVDQCALLALAEHDPAAHIDKYRQGIGNDERQFNGPGVRVPMVSLSRVGRKGEGPWPYPEYHSSHDNLDAVSFDAVDDSVALTLDIIDRIEGNRRPRNRYKGEAFCSRYGVHIDYYANPEAHRSLFELMDHIDGTRTVAELAETCGVSFGAVQTTLNELSRHNLISFED